MIVEVKREAFHGRTFPTKKPGMRRAFS